MCLVYVNKEIIIIIIIFIIIIIIYYSLSYFYMDLSFFHANERK